MTVLVPGPWVYAEHDKTERLHLVALLADRAVCGARLTNLIVEDEITSHGERATCSLCRKRSGLEPVEVLK